MLSTYSITILGPVTHHVNLCLIGQLWLTGLETGLPVLMRSNKRSDSGFYENPIHVQYSTSTGCEFILLLCVVSSMSHLAAKKNISLALFPFKTTYHLVGANWFTWESELEAVGADSLVSCVACVLPVVLSHHTELISWELQLYLKTQSLAGSCQNSQ